MATVNIYDSIALLEPVTVYADSNQDVSSAPSSIDGVTLSNDDRIALGNQTDKTQTGIWIFAGVGNPMTRATDMATGAVIKSNTLFGVQGGNQQDHLFYSFINNGGTGDITVGTTEVISKRVNDDSLPYGPVIPNSSDTQADATLIEYVHTVCVLASYNNGSVKLPFYSAGKYCIINNRLRAYSVKVYPFLGGYIRGSAGTNQPITLQAGEIVVFRGVGDTGLGQEWIPDNTISQLIRTGVKFMAPSEDAVFNAIRTEVVTGVEVSFTNPQRYGSVATPETGNITDDLTGALEGIVQKIYHNNGTEPTYPAGWVNIGGTYTTSSLNIIYAEWVSGTRVEYWIVTP